MEDACAIVPRLLGLEADALRLSAHIFDGHDGAEVPDARLLLPLKLHSYAQASVERASLVASPETSPHQILSLTTALASNHLLLRSSFPFLHGIPNSSCWLPCLLRDFDLITHVC
ncbi:hypothetical protein GUJ93_ZPchr0010g9053 [Zizania palustris]|uniref:Uncharacterized protein n=1 Tax=Zizania palustris TaxID=103762 RepID=A0A8J6BN51_ZIZPA|nr:hypothetical protein GUJ93_ZPchr0010g9053 [Zizania palustris]